MRLTGEQALQIQDISDGAVVFLSKPKGSQNLTITREEDNLQVTIAPDGTILEEKV